MSFKSSLSSQTIEDVLVNAMTKNNTQEYTPTSDYNPATKKYVDENAGKQIVLIPTDGSESGQEKPVSIQSLGSSMQHKIILNYNGASDAQGEAMKYTVKFENGPVFFEGVIEKGGSRSASVLTNMPDTSDLVIVSFTVSSASDSNSVSMDTLQCKYIQRTVTEEQYEDGGYNDDIIYYVVPNA